MSVVTYPEHDKLKAIRDKSQVIGEFLEWCETKGLLLGMWETGGGPDRFYPVHIPVNNLLADYFGIDLRVLENEKRAMLAEQRKLNTLRGNK